MAEHQKPARANDEIERVYGVHTVAEALKNMDAVRDASEDYENRAYGAAQFQVVFYGAASADLPRRERDEEHLRQAKECIDRARAALELPRPSTFLGCTRTPEKIPKEDHE